MPTVKELRDALNVVLSINPNADLDIAGELLWVHLDDDWKHARKMEDAGFEKDKENGEGYYCYYP